ncbi:hypothetical protein PHMEG_0005527 [Phytophthora megakarya]|uniref:Uncharacterized protein n=1 Tax=Phytophthora megakarya TaxID=4795 RepID=A0A225WSP2_9STRA|nr:hypothetical protein PHMEG_0005527 [Phytophthora megakarya]
MMKFKETAEACELVRLLYGVLSNRSPTESQNAYFKANKFAGYATTNACVDVDLSKIPLNTPVVMVSSVGTKLNLPEEAPCFVKLVESDGMIIIQSTDTSVKCLILDAFQQCVFGEAEHALRFKLRALSDGLIVFIETSTGCALEAELRDATTVMLPM